MANHYFPHRPAASWARPALHAALFACALALYTFTLHPDVQPADSGEFQIAAITLGIPHPPGYPLYTMLGWLFAQAPIGSPYARVSFLSAVASAAALVLVSLTVSQLATPIRRRSRSLADAFRACAVECGPGLVAALALGLSTTFWAQATTANIRSLTAFFTALIAWRAARAWSDPRPSSVAWFAAALGFGVGHHASLAFPGGVLAIGVAMAAVRARMPAKGCLIAALAFSATQLVWLYLPLRDAAGARFAPGSLTTLDGLVYHVFARGFAGDMFAFAAPEFLADRLSLLPTLLAFQFSLPVLLLAAAGAACLMVRRTFAGVWLLAAFALHLFITLTYRAPQTVEYAMPAWVILCVALGGGLGALLAGRPAGDGGTPALAEARPGRRWPIARRAAAAGLLLAAFFTTRDGLDRLPSYQALAADRSARALAEGALANAAPGATIWSQWHQATPMWALQEVEGLRRDVSVAYVYPRGAEPYADTFADRAAESAAGGSAYVTSLFTPQLAARGVCAAPQPGLSVWAVAACPAGDGPATSPARLTFDARIEVTALDAETGTVALGQVLELIVAWRAAGPIAEGESLTIRILRPDGRLAANADIRLGAVMRAGAERSRRVALGIPLNLPPGEYPVLVGAYRAGAAGFEVLAERGGAEYAALASVRVTAAAAPPISRRPMGGAFPAGGRPSLVGVDYDTGIAGQLRLLTHWRLSELTATLTVQSAEGQPLAPGQALPAASQPAAAEYVTAIFDVPPWLRLRLAVAPVGQPAVELSLPDFEPGERYVAYADQMVLTGSRAWREGGRLVVDVNWLSARAITTDFVVSARVAGSNIFAVHDGVPAQGAIPTLKWIRGSAVADRHAVALPQQAAGLAATVLVYDGFTQQELPALDERYDQGITVWRSE